jgi:hypothetical protein
MMTNVIAKSKLANLNCKQSVQDIEHKSTQVIDYQKIIADYEQLHKGYSFLRRYPNKDYLNGLKDLPLRSCLKHHNSDRFSALKVKTSPKWYTDLLVSQIDTETGELTDFSIYTTNEFKQANGRKIKAINTFVDYFQPLYKRRQISMLFYTLTLAEYGKPIADVINAFKKRCKRNGTPIIGYVWISEVSEDLHWHYHIAVAINRINVKGKGLPDYLKLDDLWTDNITMDFTLAEYGKQITLRTGVQFVRKNIRHYMSKYFAKNPFKIIAYDNRGLHKIIRVYGKSIPKK